MHEASIALSILDIARKHCEEAGYTAITSISVDIGSASGILPDALSMAFDIVKLETPANDASLLINEIPIGGNCSGCGQDFITDEMFILACPHCGDRNFKLTTGRELDIKEIEVD
jgi:hydrogenase nickel incorporation protein HypA/HybF